MIATGGALGAPVKWESSAEKAAKEQARLLEEQNELLASLARSNHRSEQSPLAKPSHRTGVLRGLHQSWPAIKR